MKDDFQEAADLLLITADQAVGMLEIAGWETLVEPDALANATGAIQTILDALIAGEPIGDPVAALQHLLNLLATPAGTLNAIAKAGASDETLAEVASLVASGVPPGIVVRIAKQGLRNGLTPEESSAQLDVLATAVADGGDVSWGQVANEATVKGNSKKQDETAGMGEGTSLAEPSEHVNGKKDDDREKNEGKGLDKHGLPDSPASQGIEPEQQVEDEKPAQEEDETSEQDEESTRGNSQKNEDLGQGKGTDTDKEKKNDK